MNWFKYNWVLLLVMTLFFTRVSSQSIETEGTRLFEISWSNDIIFGTDYYYSNGLELGYYAPLVSKLPSKYILLPHKKGELVWHGITLTQHFFTPRIKSIDKSESDRPFASYLLLGHRKISSNPIKGLKKQSEFQIGILGKYSGGESIQNGIHKILPASGLTLGWDNQLSPDLAINYKVKIYYGILRYQNFEIIPTAKLNLGIPYTDIGVGTRLRIGKLNDYFSDIGISKNKPWQLYFFTDVSVKYVVYNGTIQGGLLNEHVHVVSDINNWRAELNTGIVFSRKNIGIEFGQHLISSEIVNGKSHAWGYISFRLAF